MYLNLCVKKLHCLSRVHYCKFYCRIDLIQICVEGEEVQRGAGPHQENVIYIAPPPQNMSGVGAAIHKPLLQVGHIDVSISRRHVRPYRHTTHLNVKIVLE